MLFTTAKACIHTTWSLVQASGAVVFYLSKLFIAAVIWIPIAFQVLLVCVSHILDLFIAVISWILDACYMIFNALSYVPSLFTAIKYWIVANPWTAAYQFVMAVAIFLPGLFSGSILWIFGFTTNGPRSGQCLTWLDNFSEFHRLIQQ